MPALVRANPFENTCLLQFSNLPLDSQPRNSSLFGQLSCRNRGVKSNQPKDFLLSFLLSFLGNRLDPHLSGDLSGWLWL